jgi:hypothetical protein
MEIFYRLKFKRMIFLFFFSFNLNVMVSVIQSEVVMKFEILFLLFSGLKNHHS